MRREGGRDGALQVGDMVQVLKGATLREAKAIDSLQVGHTCR